MRDVESRDKYEIIAIDERRRDRVHMKLHDLHSFR